MMVTLHTVKNKSIPLSEKLFQLPSPVPKAWQFIRSLPVLAQPGHALQNEDHLCEAYFTIIVNVCA
jgi:hypothetical protein